MARRSRKRGRITNTLPPLLSLAELPEEIRRQNGTVMTSSWVDPDDIRPNASRAPREVRGWRSFCPLRRCIASHGARSSFTSEHVEAADRLRAVHDGACLGFSGLIDWRPVQSATYGPRSGPNTLAFRRWRCERMFAQAWTMFGTEERAIMVLVLLQNRTLTHAHVELGISRPRLTERLVRALDVLVLHFDVARMAA